ncbi:MAG: (Na+)-NQR maturation NqrM [bacterium]
MSTMILAFVFMLLMVTAMAVGVLMGRKPISGTCGGMKALGMDMDCEICGGNPALCDTDESRTAVAALAKKVDPGLSKNAGSE